MEPLTVFSKNPQPTPDLLVKPMPQQNGMTQPINTPQSAVSGGGPTKGQQQQYLNPTQGPNLNKQIPIQYDGSSMSPSTVDYPQNQIIPQTTQQQLLKPQNVYQGAQSYQMPGNGYLFQSSNPPTSNTGTAINYF